MHKEINTCSNLKTLRIRNVDKVIFPNKLPNSIKAVTLRKCNLNEIPTQVCNLPKLDNLEIRQAKPIKIINHCIFKNPTLNKIKIQTITEEQMNWIKTNHNVKIITVPQNCVVIIFVDK